MMPFDLKQSIEILERTPRVVTDMLRGLSGDWVGKNEGPDTWSPYDIVGHFIHGEKTDWLARMHIILSDSGDKKFQPFDRFAQVRDSKGKTLSQLLDEFKSLREQNLQVLRSLDPTAEDLARQGIHPAFGPVTLSQLLATWVVHDLNHIAQIARVMASQYRPEVGPWVAYLRVLQTSGS
jgi:DinB superfamily